MKQLEEEEVQQIKRAQMMVLQMVQCFHLDVIP